MKINMFPEFLIILQVFLEFETSVLRPFLYDNIIETI